MKYMSYPYMDIFFGENADAYRKMHMTLSLLFIPYGCMVDEFQHRIYMRIRACRRKTATEYGIGSGR